MAKQVKGKRPQDITGAEKEKRIKEVQELLIKGASRWQIIEYCRENYKTSLKSEAGVDLYIHEAKQRIKDNFQKHFDSDYYKANLFERLEDLYRQNQDIDDYRECRNVIKDLRDMLGFDAVKKSEVKVTTELTEEEIMQQLEKIKNKVV